MRCDPLTQLEADRTTNLLRCPRCGDTRPLPALPLAHGIALNGRATVLCGSLQPEQLERLPARPLVGEIHFCNLDCPDDVLAERLRDRPAWRGWNEQRIAEQLRFAASLRSRIGPTFDTSTRSVEEVADQVARWITGHLRTQADLLTRPGCR